MVTWHIDATSRAVPVLVGEWHVPESHLGGAVEIVPETAAGAPSSFTVSARFASGPAPEAGVILNTRPPQICDLSLCMPDLGDGPIQEGPVALFQVIRNWRGDFLTQLHKRDWLVFDVQTDDGRGPARPHAVEPRQPRHRPVGEAVLRFRRRRRPLDRAGDAAARLAEPAPALPGLRHRPGPSPGAGLGAEDRPTRRRRAVRSPADGCRRRAGAHPRFRRLDARRRNRRVPPARRAHPARGSRTAGGQTPPAASRQHVGARERWGA